MEGLNYNPNNYLKFDNNFAPIFKDALAGDPKALDLPEIRSLGMDNLKKALQWLQQNDLNTDYKDLLMREGWRLAYKRKPPTPEEYLTPEWIGVQAEGLWPNVKKAFLEFMDPNPLNPKRGLALSTSIGWGKSLLSNLCVSYDMVLFCLMREPFRQLGHSQPVYEKVKLPDGKYTTIDDLKIGMEIAGVTQEVSKVIDIIEQGEKETYEITFEKGQKVRCSLDHLWTVFDSKEEKYKVMKTEEIFKDLERYFFPEEDDCKKDYLKILKAEEEFEKTNSFGEKV